MQGLKGLRASAKRCPPSFKNPLVDVSNHIPRQMIIEKQNPAYELLYFLKGAFAIAKAPFNIDLFI